MPDESDAVASSPYALGQLNRALARLTAEREGTAGHRQQAQEKLRRWQDVLAGMASGRITVGSRTPVSDTPAWVTLEVAHGGFATGAYLAEAPLTDDETARLAALPTDLPGVSDRERLNLWYLSDPGQQELLDALNAGHYRVEVPEEAALAAVVLLLRHGFRAEALDLLAELRPLMHRLRFTPRFESIAAPSGTAVRLATAVEAAAALRAVREPLQLTAMRATLRVWNPLHDKLVALWSQTVEGETPYLDEDGGVHGGWPCRRWPRTWADERAAWLADYERACAAHPPSGRHAHRRSNFTRLRLALLSCPDGSGALSARDVGWIRRALANTLTRHGAPQSDRLEAVRAEQATVAARPTHAELAVVVARRLDRYPDGGGVPSLDPIAADVSEQDTGLDIGQAVATGTPIPPHLVDKAARALEAPPDELIRRGVITSGEVLAIVLPQLTSQVVADDIGDPVLAGLYQRTYAAFRRRRSLLLLNLESQVRFEELPWVTALGAGRSPRSDSERSARRVLEQGVMLGLTAFPQTLLPNPLIGEYTALARRAAMQLPLVEEVAADIFMGTFTTKWRASAAVASQSMAGTLYAAYYDLPQESLWTEPVPESRRWGKKTATDFGNLCAERAKEAGKDSRAARFGGYVARNGAVLEQSQILTTHNLAVLVDGLDLSDQVRERAPELVGRTLGWMVTRLGQRAPGSHAALIQVKNAAYAWRQAIFLLSYCELSVQAELVERLRAQVAGSGIATRFRPAVDGLAHVLAGGRFTSDGTAARGSGRRFLGWAVGRHWYLA